MVAGNEWWVQARAVPVGEVAAALGLSQGRGGSWGPCPACGEDRRDRRGAVGLRRDGAGWECHKCHTTGDSIDLAARVLHGARGRELRPDQARELREWYAERGWVSREGEDTVGNPTWSPPVAEPPKRIDRGELRQLWDLGVAVADDPAVAAYLRGRGIDPAQLPATVARALPDQPPELAWWPKTWGAWRLGAILRELDGTPAALHARALGAATPKTRNPLGAQVSGLVFACPEAIRLLRGESQAAQALVVEGLSDWLKAVVVVGGRMPVLGGISGSFRELGRVGWPAGCRVWIATDADEAGDRYAVQAREALGERALRLRPPEGQDFDDWIQSWTDLERALSEARPASEVVETVVAEIEAGPDLAARLRTLADALRSPRFCGALGELQARAPGEVAALALRLRAAGIDGQTRAHLLTLAREGAEQVASPAPERRESGAVLEMLKGILGEHPIPALLQPQGWEVDARGVWRLRSAEGEIERLRVAEAPLLISRRLVDLETGATHLQLDWPEESRAGRRWSQRVVARSDAADRRGLTRLADYGAPVHSGNAGELVSYLAGLEAANRRTIPESRATAHLGWQGERGELGFLLGRTLYRDGTAYEASADGGIHLLTPDAGQDQLADGYRTLGSWEGWKGALAAVLDRPSLWIAIYAALLPPLMGLCPEIPGFTVDWSGTTSHGKTTALRLAASVWGCPDQGQAGSVLHTWDTSATWIERALSTGSGLPLILDDTKRARRVSVADVLYDVAAGQGAGRGTITGLQRRGCWRTVLLSSGEVPASTLGRDGEEARKHGGAAARVLELWGSPLGEVGAAGARLADALEVASREHYGHLGQRLIVWLTRERPVSQLQARYRALTAPWTAASNGNAVASRAARYVGALALAREIAERALGLPVPTCDPLALAWGAVCAASQEADRATAALQLVLSWAAGNRRRFWGCHETGSRGQVISPPQEWYGCWSPEDGWRELGIRPEILESLLRREGYDTQAIVKVWAERGWLVRDGRNLGPKRSIDGARTRVYALSRASLPPEEEEK